VPISHHRPDQLTDHQPKPTLLFICGMSGSAFLFRRFFPSIENDWRFLVYEHCAADAASTGRLPIRDMAGQVLRLLDVNNIAAATVCGESFGGPIAQELCRLAPDRIRRLILVSTFAKYPIRPFECVALSCEPLLTAGASLLPRLFTQFAKRGYNPLLIPDDPKELKQAARDEPPITPATVIRKSALAARYDSRPWLSQISIPTTVLCGRQDRLIPYQCSIELAGLLPNSRLQIIDNAGHLVSYRHPLAFQQILATCEAGP
jgi:pimeloyl-ACP methyl ester carboxylesterase